VLMMISSYSRDCVRLFSLVITYLLSFGDALS
jgi:hypothetical protein